MRVFLSLAAAALLLSVHIFFSARIWKNQERVRSETPSGYVIPSRYSRILALGNQGLLSDYLFLKTMTFFGGRSESGPPLGEDDWQYIIKSLDVTTDLDPYFVDPYFFAEGILAWEAGKPGEANKLLIKGTKYRTSDWRLPFFVGFNYFYFLGDNASGAKYIMIASKLPGSPNYFPMLAARLAYYGGKSKTALLFLRQMLAETDNAMLHRRLELRLQALERAVLIEGALEKFKKVQKRLPNKLNELVTQGYLPELPKDPYGGKWVILKNGRVFSTSKFVEKNRKSKK